MLKFGSKILAHNKPDQLMAIMHIQFKFSLEIYRKIPRLVNFSGNERSIEVRKKGINLFYESDLYQAADKRGRKGEFNHTMSRHQLDLMLPQMVALCDQANDRQKRAYIAATRLPKIQS